MIKRFAKMFKVFLFVQLVTTALLLFRPEISVRSWLNSLRFSFDVVAILPPVILILGLLDSWVPAQFIKGRLGKTSGAQGWLAAVLLGSFGAGPLFSAFPIATALAGKGARTANVVIFLGSWATIKLPMLIMESHFLGAKFSVLRLVLTLPLIILTGLFMERMATLPEPETRAVVR